VQFDATLFTKCFLQLLMLVSPDVPTQDAKDTVIEYFNIVCGNMHKATLTQTPNELFGQGIDFPTELFSGSDRNVLLTPTFNPSSDNKRRLESITENFLLGYGRFISTSGLSSISSNEKRKTVKDRAQLISSVRF